MRYYQLRVFFIHWDLNLMHNSTLFFYVASSCEMKLLNSTAQLVEPLESRKFARFSLSYTEREEKPDGVDNWEPRFAGHQSLREREDHVSCT